MVRRLCTDPRHIDDFCDADDCRACAVECDPDCVIEVADDDPRVLAYDLEHQ